MSQIVTRIARTLYGALRAGGIVWALHPPRVPPTQEDAAHHAHDRKEHTP